MLFIVTRKVHYGFHEACEDDVMNYLVVLCTLGVIFGLCNGLVRLVIILSRKTGLL